MALIYPKQPSAGTKSNAERKVFYALKELLSDEYTVLHSLPVYKRSGKNSPLEDGEIDFLILHPSKGMLGIEVKGGGIEVNSETGLWFSTDFQDVKNPIKNPYEQIKSHIHTLGKEVAKNTDLFRFSFPYGHAVWFPDIDLKDISLGMSIELKGITLDASALKRAPDAISQLFRNSIGLEPRKIPGPEGVKEFRKFYAPSRKISVNLSRKISMEKEEMYEATRSQYKILTYIERHNRAAISGAAGSGKTFLAVEKARRIIEKDPAKKVLIVCYNKVLAQFLRSIIPFPNQIDVFHYHGLCIDFCRKAKINIPTPDPHAKLDNFFENELSDCLLDSLENIEERYNALIIDEGQDFHQCWWLPLQELLDDPNEGMFYIFFDDNQAIYRKKSNYPLDSLPFSLNENCRNTKQIHLEVMKYYQGDLQPQSVGPEGCPPEHIIITSEIEERDKLSEILQKLLKIEKVSPLEIIVLTPRKEEQSKWKSGDILANYKVTWNVVEPGRESKILCSTIHSFKGLESSIVILTETKSIWDAQRKELLYVATSRANSRLIIFDQR
jgi:hypothetical protein